MDYETIEKEKIALIFRMNRICFRQDFKFYIVSKIKRCPNGLTYDVVYDKERDKFCFVLMTKIYGYESWSNNGLDVYSDHLDYWSGEDVTPEIEAYAEEYFKEKYPDIYNNPRYDFHSHPIPEKYQLFMDAENLSLESIEEHIEEQ